MRRATVLLCSVLSLAVAVPNGQYHQEYNYKSSSSSYKNNELQHKNDDSGYYSKDGDLEGRFKPKVNAHNEHSEYMNPKLQTHSHTGVSLDENGQMNSYGQLNAQNYGAGGYDSRYGSSLGSNNLLVEGLAGSDSYQGSRGGYQYSGSYGVNSAGSHRQNYGMSSNLQGITHRLQSQLERQLQDAIYDTQRSSSYSVSSSQSMRELEEELRRNLTERLQDELRNQYGSQSIKGGYSYTINGGRIQPTANYDNQELTDLTRQVENTLLNKLHNEYRQYGSSSSSSSSSNNAYQQNYQYGSTTYRPYSTLYPNIHSTTYRPYIYSTTTLRPSYTTYSSNYQQYNQQASSQIRYTPVTNPESITVIASNVQSDLDRRLNELLENVQRQYFSSNSRGLTNYDVVLNRLQDELRSNVTFLLEEQLRRNYGTQHVRDGYMYTQGPQGQQSSQYNYSVRDLENLKSQIERNLLQKLNSDFQSRKSRYEQSYSSSSSSSSRTNYGSNYGSYDSNNLDLENYSTRPAATHLAPLISAGQSGIKTHNNNYRYTAGSSSASSASLAQLQRQLQEDLSRQLQQAISKTQYSHSGGYSSGSYSPQAFQVSLQQLSDELNRNLTRQLEEARSGYSSYSSYGSSGFTDQQLAGLRSQLQSDLLRQLQQGLQQSWSSSSSYSASSSSSNFRPVRAFDNAMSQYVDGEDCQHDDPATYLRHRQRRHSGRMPYGRSYNAGSYGQQPNYNAYGNNYMSQQVDAGQQVEDVGQVVEDDDFGKLQLARNNNKYYRGQQVETGQEEVDLGQVEVEDDFGKLHVGNQQLDSPHMGQQVETGQEPEDLGQVVEEDDFAKLQVGNQQINKYLGQEPEDLGQVVEEDDFAKLEVGNQQSQTGQEQLDVGQFVEEDNFSKLQVGNQQSNKPQGRNNNKYYRSQRQDQVDLGQVEEEDDFGKLQVGNQQIQTGQEPLDVGQVVEEDDFAKLQVANQQSNMQLTRNNNKYRGQQLQTGQEQVDLGQVVEEDDFGKLQVGNQHLGQQPVDAGQVVEEDDFGKLQVGNQHLGQQPVDAGQVIEEDNFGKLQVGNQQEEVQQVEEEDFSKLQVGNQQSTGQEQEDLGQVVEEDDFSKLQVGNLGQQQLETGQQQIDLGQVQIGQQDIPFHKIQVGSQLHGNQINKQASVENNNQNKFYNQYGYADLNQQIEDGALGMPQNTLQQQQQQDRNKLFMNSIANSGNVASSNTEPTTPKVNDLTRQIASIQQNQTNVQGGLSVQDTLALQSGSQVIPQPTNTNIDSTVSQQSLDEANREADRLIEAIRASRRNQNPLPYNYGGSQHGFGQAYPQNQYQQSSNNINTGIASDLSQQTINDDGINAGSQVSYGSGRYLTRQRPIGSGVNPTEQPESERTYESRTEINLSRPYGNSGYGRPGNRQHGYGYSHRVNYGSQHQIGQQIETTADLEPIQPIALQSPVLVHQAIPVYPYSQTPNLQATPQQNSYNTRVNYGVQSQVDYDEREPTSDVGIVQVAPTVVEPVVQTQPKVVAGVKGGYRTRVSAADSSLPQPSLDVVPVSNTDVEPTEQPSWWKRFGNKVKEGATSIKEKIVG